MAKLRDTNVNKKLEAGQVLVGGKAVALADHKHTTRDIDQLEDVIDSRIAATSINANTLGGYASDAFVLSENYKAGKVYKFEKSFIINPLDTGIYISESIFSLNFYRIEISDGFNNLILDKNEYDYNLQQSVRYNYYIMSEGPVEFKIQSSSAPNIYIRNFCPVSLNKGENAHIMIKFFIRNDYDSPADYNPIDQYVQTPPYIRNGYFTPDFSPLITEESLQLNNIDSIQIINGVTKQNQYIRVLGDRQQIESNRILRYFKINSTSPTIYDLNNNYFIDLGTYKTNIPTSVGKVKFNEGYLDCSLLSDNLFFSNGIVINGEKPINTNLANLNNECTYINESNIYYSILYNKLQFLRNYYGIKDIPKNITINNQSHDISSNISIPTVDSFSATINGKTLTNGANIILDQPTNINATTLNGLNSDQFVKSDQVIAGTGKIARYNQQGHLIYPDGSEEWIANG